MKTKQTKETAAMLAQAIMLRIKAYKARQRGETATDTQCLKQAQEIEDQVNIIRRGKTY